MVSRSEHSDRLFDEKGMLWEDEAFVEKPSGPKGLLEAVSLLRNQNRCIGDVYLEQTRAAQPECP